MDEEYVNRWLENATEAVLTNVSWSNFKANPSILPLGVEVDEDVEYTPYAERSETYIVPVVFAIIFVVGVLGNGTLVVVFLRHRAMRNVPNTYIFSLALADLLVIVTSVPFASLIYTLESWPWGGALCKMSECARDISIGVSVFTLTALSAERYCAIVNPLRKLQTRPMTVLSASLIWVLAVVCALPAAIISDAIPIELTKNHTIYVCSPFIEGTYKDTYTKCNVAAKALIYYLLPLSVIAFFYILMARRLQASARELPGALHGTQSASQARARRHVARMVLAFVIVFIVCFLPYHVFMLWFHFHPTAMEDYDEWWHALRIIGFCLGFLNSCVNPIALYCVSGVFRQHFNRYLCCKRPVGQRMSRRSRSQALETSFNSTCRRHTQDTHIGSYRSPRMLTTADTVVVTTFDGVNSKQNNSSYVVKNMSLGSNLSNNKDACYLTTAGVTTNNTILR
ncbi:neuropeptide CCHamide-2 receptor-like [Arctopsyche grandis]|uniref:neuropeptide CCHamide-2 receptor-like n=1 Tax=Arctopsyche grandis TaxID=121162 RepID=UPI00406D6F7A